MGINIISLIAIFGLPKKKFSTLAVAGIYGGIKGVAYYIATLNLAMALLALVVGCVLGYATRYLFGRLDKYDKDGEDYSRYSSKKKTKFKWEYIPIVLLIIVMIFAF
jgi:heme/copper-type cytochrome/quinol oxidase subunit 2